MLATNCIEPMLLATKLIVSRSIAARDAAVLAQSVTAGGTPWSQPCQQALLVLGGDSAPSGIRTHTPYGTRF